MSIIIKATNIKKQFGTLSVLKGIDLEVEQGQIISIVGASGAGKSTLLQILGTILPADDGSEIQIEGIEITKLKDKKLSDIRNRKIGFIFQSHNLLPEFTALENIMLPALIAGRSKAEAKEKALYLLQLLGIEERLSHYPATMSGGECQRVAIARALVNEPTVVLADEPTGSLDSKNRQSLQNIIFDLRQKLGQTFVIVTHDETFAQACDKMIKLFDGKIAEIKINQNR